MRRPPVADPVAPVLLALAAILAGAKLGGDLAERIGQPAVLGELVVGITARVLKDLGRAQSPEARIILGAAVIDDVLGLVILAVVGGVITAANQGGGLSYAAVGVILAKALLFLGGALVLGVALSPRL